MKFIKKFWSAVCKALEESLEEPQEEPYPYHRTPVDKSNYYDCPLCTYSGTAENLRTHLINDHQKKGI